MEYSGYQITYNPSAPITGKWRAVRHGVSLCANDKPMLMRMIATKIMHAREERQKAGVF